MRSRKVIVTHGGLLLEKYGEPGLALIESAVRNLERADNIRGIETHYVKLDDAADMKRYGAKTVSKRPSASNCKKAIDKLFATLTPDYLVLLGSDDIIPHFTVPNPSFAATGDTEVQITTDNPYASSVAFNGNSRASYLVPDRVVGRIADVPGSSDPSWLLNYLRTAASAQPLRFGDYGLDLMLCCAAWKNSGEACASALARSAGDLVLSPPSSIDESTAILARQSARLQMIKCHGVPLDPFFYGQSGKDFPPVLGTASLTGVSAGTVVGAMCCYGAALYDPNHPGAAVPRAPAIANAYLNQSAYGFTGSTSIAWVGPDRMACADLVVCQFLTRVMAGASLGTALLDAKQKFLADINKDGRMPDAQEEKTLLQFLLLGDPSIQAVMSHEDTVLSAGMPAGNDTYLVGRGESGREHRLLVKSTTTAAPISVNAFRNGTSRRHPLPQRKFSGPMSSGTFRLRQRSFTASPEWYGNLKGPGVPASGMR